ncbi:MAG: GTPase, partial [Bacteroidales bacterium]
EIQVLISHLKTEIQHLLDSFQKGNVLKNGIPVAIVGKPNVGKSTLLNTLLNEDRAIVSDIPGTTRDTIEDCINIQGYTFRFIDTAGLRASSDVIETFGIERSYKAMDEALIILYIVDKEGSTQQEIDELQHKYNDKKILTLVNKIDLLAEPCENTTKDTLFISAKKKINIELIIHALQAFAEGFQSKGETLISNTRHYEALHQAYDSLLQAETAFENHVPTDLVMVHVKQVLFHLGEITGEITNDDVLHSIFSSFCIGK